ncbi:hypothetical protein PoB_007475100 [Plakobranchus ocellatus]|uniref:Uncharacterized protein n=1 Tax=Plakobranchus ocellatus TaxID=259542 RepID=A0AAV4DVU3_9GAST|nr:hypothetical protein PoB_007475100 [Plakobranchus ocellatus]
MTRRLHGNLSPQGDHNFFTSTEPILPESPLPKVGHPQERSMSTFKQKTTRGSLAYRGRHSSSSSICFAIHPALSTASHLQCKATLQSRFMDLAFCHGCVPALTVVSYNSIISAAGGRIPAAGDTLRNLWYGLRSPGKRLGLTGPAPSREIRSTIRIFPDCIRLQASFPFRQTAIKMDGFGWL